MMRLLLSLSAGLGMIVAATAALHGQTDSDLKPGDPAPNFSLPGSDGRTYALADFKGKRAVVLAWFPKAFTGG